MITRSTPGFEPLRPPPPPKKKLISSNKHPPLSKTKSIICLNSAPNMSAKAEPTPAGTTQLSQKKQKKDFRGIVAPSQVDCEVFVFFVPVQVWCALKFKTCVFFVPVQVWCTLKFKTFDFLSLCRFCTLYSLNLLFVLCLWRFGMTHVC